MSGRRVPLSNNPNAANSPYRVAYGAASKQKRSYATIQREEPYGQAPPSKRQMLEVHPVLRTPSRPHSTQSSFEGRVMSRKPSSQQSTLERNGMTVRERPQQSVVKAEKAADDGQADTIRQWQKHYRKIFPTFVFYFESVPEETRIKLTKHCVALGAREEKFFSNAVTHVVTTRTIPPEQRRAPLSTSMNNPMTSSTNDSQSQNSQPQTINPSLLDRSSETTNAPSDLGTKGKFTFEATGNKRLGTYVHDGEIKRPQPRSTDALHRARELGMKIWALEKIQRMMTTMFSTETGSQSVHGHNTRSNTNTAPGTSSRAADLSQLLKNERINGPSDRDPTVATKELTLFKGPFLYVHDIDEKQRPIMVREYAKVAHKEEGDWPQFRSAPNGKCPFIEETDYSEREGRKKKEQMRLQIQQEKEKALMPKTRAASVVEAKMQPPKGNTSKRPLGETLDSANQRVVIAMKEQPNPFAPKSFPQTDREASSMGHNAFVSRAGVGRLFAGEPVASGVQPSNITSAIRSQMISSTAAQPGAKAGTSKEIHGLQRKVLEKNSGGPGSYGLASSHRMTDIAAAAAREEAVGRQTRKRSQHNLNLIEEDVDPSEAEENARRAEAIRKAQAVQQRKLEKRDPKPGYCENCQDKFEDFDEHVLSRKHRKFADKLENWQELDSLLEQLRRPLRQDFEYDC